MHLRPDRDKKCPKYLHFTQLKVCEQNRIHDTIRIGWSHCSARDTNLMYEFRSNTNLVVTELYRQVRLITYQTRILFYYFKKIQYVRC